MPPRLILLLHAGAPVAARHLWTSWEWTPGIVLPLVLAAVLYARGTRVLHRRTGRARGVTRRAAACFWTGWITLILALLSPLHALSEQLFVAHMIQHELLMVVAAPLLVLGRPMVPMLWALSPRARRRVGAVVRERHAAALWTGLTLPFAAWALHAIAIWSWHTPWLYQASLRSDAMHAGQHASFLITALLFWWAMIHPHVPGVGGARARGAAVIYLFTTTVHTGALGALLTFSRRLWYPAYAGSAAALGWGLSPLQDQQLAGLIMWIPASTIYLVAALAIFARWLRESEWRVAQRELAGLVRPGATALAAAVLLGGTLTGCADAGLDAQSAWALTGGGHAARGRQLIHQYGCGSCHTVPRVAGANATVGPDLRGIAGRAYIAGVLTNNPGNMMRWILDPPAVDSLTAMPNEHVSPTDARDIAAYLYTLK
ncbi:MAG TPA: cytochrome c oxidase assembly protein [Gemmatimonadaceae bacterium]|nr:cytochrome c oxidase assembly protein [Gemmatimonadaceae bacterium]